MDPVFTKTLVRAQEKRTIEVSPAPNAGWEV